MYGGFPDGKIWETSLFTFESKYYESVSTFIWVFQGKFVPIYLLTLWFLTCRHWWHYVILVPLGMYVFQMISLFNDEMKFKDEIEIYYMIPIMLMVAIVLLFIRRKISPYIELMSFNEKLNETIEEIEKESLK